MKPKGIPHMKLTKSQLKQLIKEELQIILNESFKREWERMQMDQGPPHSPPGTQLQLDYEPETTASHDAIDAFNYYVEYKDLHYLRDEERVIQFIKYHRKYLSDLPAIAHHYGLHKEDILDVIGNKRGRFYAAVEAALGDYKLNLDEPFLHHKH